MHNINKQHAQHKQTTCTTYTNNMYNINKQHAQNKQTTCTTYTNKQVYNKCATFNSIIIDLFLNRAGCIPYLIIYLTYDQLIYKTINSTHKYTAIND